MRINFSKIANLRILKYQIFIINFYQMIEQNLRQEEAPGNVNPP